MSSEHVIGWIGRRGRPRPGPDPRSEMLAAARRGGGPFGFGRGERRSGPFGRGPFGMPGGPFGGGPRVRRGDVRAAALALLAEGPRNGYQIIQEIEQRSDGLWRPSPGSIYPALQQLEDEGLIRATESDGRRAFQLTEAGQAYVEAHKAELTAPWRAVTDSMADGALELRSLVGQVFEAVMHVARTGSTTQVAEAKRILADARRALYRVLAEDEPADL